MFSPPHPVLIRTLENILSTSLRSLNCLPIYKAKMLGFNKKKLFTIFMNNGEWPPEKESVHRVQPEVGVPFESKEAKHIAVPLCVQI